MRGRATLEVASELVTAVPVDDLMLAAASRLDEMDLISLALSVVANVAARCLSAQSKICNGHSSVLPLDHWAATDDCTDCMCDGCDGTG